MKKLSKRLLALLLVAVMLMATGCGKGDDKPADKKDPGVEKRRTSLLLQATKNQVKWLK